MSSKARLKNIAGRGEHHPGRSKVRSSGYLSRLGPG
ncbi:MAG: hypothetical protein RL454_463, partial [Actinomycetota bacterium]